MWLFSYSSIHSLIRPVLFCFRSAMAIECRRQYLEFWWGTSVTLWTKFRLVYASKYRSTIYYFDIDHPVHSHTLVLSQVPSNMALKFADAHNMLLFETSAKDPRESQNVDSIFMSLACRLKAQKSLLYRDVEREDGRVRLSQETETKSTCPCWGKRRSGRHNGREEGRITVHVKEEEERDDGRVRQKQGSFKIKCNFSGLAGGWRWHLEACVIRK